jgi:hypothetical protein
MPAIVQDAEKAIRRVLTALDIPIDDDGFEPPKSQPFDSLLTNIPLPDKLLRKASRNLFVFSAGKAAYIPSPALLLKSYTLFYNQLVIREDSAGNETNMADDPDEGLVDIDEFSVIGKGEPLTYIAMEEENGKIYAAVAEAILDRFADIEAEMAEAREDGDEDGELDEEEYREEYGLKCKLKGEELTTWLGVLHVQCAGSSGIERETLHEKWQNLVARSWWGFCDVDALMGKEMWGGKFEGFGNGKLRYVEKQEEAAASSAGPAGTAEGAGKDEKKGTKRNWHERFAKDR